MGENIAIFTTMFNRTITGMVVSAKNLHKVGDHQEPFYNTLWSGTIPDVIILEKRKINSEICHAIILARSSVYKIKRWQQLN
jgi:hypothetical protein